MSKLTDKVALYQMQKGNLSRREFIKDLGLLTALGFVAKNEIIDAFRGYRKEQAKGLTDYLLEGEATIKYKMPESDKIKEYKNKHSAFYMPDYGYITCGHTVNLKEARIMTPFGISTTPVQTIDRCVTYKGKELQEMVVRPDKDISIFKPTGDMPAFPYGMYDQEDPIDFQEPVWIVGNPWMKGKKMREANIMNLCERFEQNGEIDSYVLDNYMIPGDSGSFSVRKKDNSILGMNVMMMRDRAGSAKFGVVTDIYEIPKVYGTAQKVEQVEGL